MIGTKEGSILTVNTTEPESRTKYHGIINNEIEGLFTLKGKNIIVATYPGAMTLYSLNH